MKIITLLLLSFTIMFCSMMTGTADTSIVKINKVEVYFNSATNVLHYISGMNIDADGSPHAYHPDDTSGIDRLSAAGKKGNWWGIATDEKGDPFIQSKQDPAPGFYVSTTSLQDVTKKISDPQRYVNAEEIPYIVLPNNKVLLKYATKGDLAMVVNLRSHDTAYAIFADVGPADKIGEGSIRLAQELKINASPRHGGVADSIAYFIFSRSGNGKPQSSEAIDSIGRRYAHVLQK